MKKKGKQIEEIVLMAQEGDYSRFNELYEIHKNELYYFLLTLLNVKPDAEDIVQETFLTAFQRIDDLKNPRSFKTWIYSIAYSKAMNANTNIRSKQESLSEYPYLEGDTSDEELTDYEKNALMNEITGAMNKLSPKLYTVAELKYFQGFTIREISEILNIPEGTVKNRLMRTKEIMTESLKLKGVTPNANSFSVVGMITLFFIESQNMHTLSRQIDSDILKQIGALGSTGFLTISERVTHIIKESAKQIGFGFVVVGTVVAGGTVIKNQQIKIEIEDIRYSPDWSNEEIPIQIVFDHHINDYNQVSVIYNSKEIKSIKKDKTLVFNARENGTYTILTEGEEKKIMINNLDFQDPELLSVSQEENELVFLLEDKESQINYEKSYILYQNQRIKIPETGKLMGQYDGNMKVVLYDNANNHSEYNIDMSVQSSGGAYD